MAVVADLILQNQLEMKVVDIVFPLNGSYVLINFVAEKRVDFRQLLKDLAAYFKTRIELHQISSREESKIYGGLGPCGRALCCSLVFWANSHQYLLKWLKIRVCP